MSEKYEQHRKEFGDLQRELNELEADESLSDEEFAAKFDEISQRRMEWFDRDKKFRLEEEA